MKAEQIIHEAQRTQLAIYERRASDLVQPCDFMELGIDEDKAHELYNIVQKAFINYQLLTPPPQENKK